MQLYLGIKYKKTEYDLYKESKQVVEDLKARLIKAKNSPNSSAALVAAIRAELRDADGICDAHRRDVKKPLSPGQEEALQMILEDTASEYKDLLAPRQPQPEDLNQ